jgi:hypothetical protein
MSTLALAMSRAARPQCIPPFCVVGNSAADASLDTSVPDFQRTSQGGNHHEANPDNSCVSRLPRNGRGFRVCGGREQRYESRRQRRVWQLSQFFRRRLLSAAHPGALYIAGLPA